MKANTALIVLLIVVIILVPLIFKQDGEFGGSDDQAEGVIADIDANAEPWFSPIWEPPSGEIESLLFSVQVAIGAVFIGYFIGKYKERSRNASH